MKPMLSNGCIACICRSRYAAIAVLKCDLARSRSEKLREALEVNSQSSRIVPTDRRIRIVPCCGASPSFATARIWAAFGM